MFGVWFYHHNWFRHALEDHPERFWREGIARAYAAILALLGLAAFVGGVFMLLSFLVDVIAGDVLWGSGMREQLSAGISLLAVGFPLWYFTWKEFQAQAQRADDNGERARRSLIRRIYLYLVLFVGVAGGMAAAVRILFVFLNALLGEGFSGFGHDFLDGLQYLLVFVIVLWYHWSVLRDDSRMEKEVLSRRYAAFPVGVVGQTEFAQGVEKTLQRRAPQMPVTLLPPRDVAIPEDIRAIILPRSLLLSAPSTLLFQLEQFSGPKVVVPDEESPGWLWASDGKDALAAVLRLAEGYASGGGRRPAWWMVVLYVLGAFFGVQMLIALLSFFAD